MSWAEHDWGGGPAPAAQTCPWQASVKSGPPELFLTLAPGSGNSDGSDPDVVDKLLKVGRFAFFRKDNPRHCGPLECAWWAG